MRKINLLLSLASYAILPLIAMPGDPGEGTVSNGKDGKPADLPPSKKGLKKRQRK